MVEVVKSTFAEQYPLIIEAIKDCDFIALDTEFTGLSVDSEMKPSLFDDGALRYQKLRETASKITMCQLGLSIFSKTSKDNQYEAKTFNFYLYPCSGYGPVDSRFVCQASSLKFLCRYDFDFNKFIYEGVSYVNEVEEKQIRDHIDVASRIGLERDIDENALQKICSIVANWIVNSEEEVKKLQKEDMEKIPTFLLNCELRTRFPNIRTTVNKIEKCIEIKKVSAEERLDLETTEVEDEKLYQQNTIEKCLGFARIFRIMKQYKKGLESTELLQFTSLGQVYTDLESDVGRDLVIHPPTVVHAEGFDRYHNKMVVHEAGFDAYMCGFVFLRIAHILTFKDTPSTDVIPCMFRRYLQSLDDYVNKINVIRASVNNINIGGNDDVSTRPELLYVRSSMLKYKLNIDQF
ncbi:Poly(A)-specific ribonuclease pnldc1 [Mactra antiquata]